MRRKFSEKKLKMLKQWYADNIKNDEIKLELQVVRMLIHQLDEFYYETERPDYEMLERLMGSFTYVCRQFPDFPFHRGWNLNS